MNDIKFTCPHCGQRVSSDESAVGQQLNCPACKEIIEVPGKTACRRPTCDRRSRRAVVMPACFLAVAGGIWLFGVVCYRWRLKLSDYTLALTSVGCAFACGRKAAAGDAWRGSHLRFGASDGLDRFSDRLRDGVDNRNQSSGAVCNGRPALFQSQPPFSRPPVRPPVLSTAFTPIAIS